MRMRAAVPIGARRGARLASFLALLLCVAPVSALDGEAVPGEPFGVGRISVRLPDGAAATWESRAARKRGCQGRLKTDPFAPVEV